MSDQILQRRVYLQQPGSVFFCVEALALCLGLGDGLAQLSAKFGFLVQLGCSSTPLAQLAPQCRERRDRGDLEPEHDTGSEHGNDLERGDIELLDEEVNRNAGHREVLAQAERQAETRRLEGALSLLDLRGELLGVRFGMADPGDALTRAPELNDRNVYFGNQRHR
jgi:hypothetical protein